MINFLKVGLEFVWDGQHRLHRLPEAVLLLRKLAKESLTYNGNCLNKIEWNRIEFYRLSELFVKAI